MTKDQLHVGVMVRPIKRGGRPLRITSIDLIDDLSAHVHAVWGPNFTEPVSGTLGFENWEVTEWTQVPLCPSEP